MNETMDRRKLFAHARSFAVYYGHNQAQTLARYDIAILEPAGQTADTLKEMRETKGTFALAYVSMTEVPEYDPLKPLLHDNDYLEIAGAIVGNAVYRTRVADLRSPAWTGLILHRIGHYLRHLSYDGIFMDTLSNVEWNILPAGVQAEQQAAAVELITRIRALYPTHILVQNNGIQSLCWQTAPLIDGICWENPDFIRPETFAWHKSAKARLRKLMRRFGIQIMLLQEESTAAKPAIEAARYWAKRERFLHYAAPAHYLEVR
ncbi:MAG TPA: hypothetical protein VF260_00950 [Bacilli bacterium]